MYGSNTFLVEWRATAKIMDVPKFKVLPPGPDCCSAKIAKLLTKKRGAISLSLNSKHEIFISSYDQCNCFLANGLFGISCRCMYVYVSYIVKRINFMQQLSNRLNNHLIIE